ncbi:MAG: M1 family metallopeptidase [Flavobacteriaceae bacterium]|nr:M1 family metallopeptidase [Flavobacteriaceae bacterium]
MKNILYFTLILFTACATQKVDNEKVKINPKLITQPYSPEILRGSNTEFRNWWDVKRYDIVLVPDYSKKFISGTINIEYEIISNNNQDVMQIDLQEPMQITRIVQLAQSPRNHQTQTEFELPEYAWKRNGNTVLIDMEYLPKKDNSRQILKFHFEGFPKIAKNAPWDGGWVFTKDEKGRPWMSAAVQGLGASAWFPNKDFQGDEPDEGITFTIIVPEDLVAVANGRLWETSFVKGEAGTNVYTWEVKNPINNYSIIPYIGHYTHFSDAFYGKGGELSLDYWVLDYQLEKAKKHFEQVKPMLTAFEDWMGKYPFYEDGFKLVESPYLGMEHQSAIAYGNQYVNGYLGHDRTESGWGNKFDFIIVHEAGHEWFGNSITTQDIADMWVHEAFTTYSEVMYVENLHGQLAANEYVQGLKILIENTSPIIGKSYGTHSGGSRDMYYKGAMVIHTLRQLMEDDVKFKQMIRDINTEFFRQIVTSAQIEKFMSDYTKIDLTEFFQQYLRTTLIPTLEVKIQNNQKMYRWIGVIDGFDMPVKLKNSEEWLYPTSQWKKYTGKSELTPDANFYVFVNQSNE